MFALFQFLVMLVGVGLMLGGGFSTMESGTQQPGALFYVGIAVLGIFVLASFIPAIALTIRRFHDQDKSGWFFLIQFIPYVGGIIVFVFMCLDGTRGPNRFGPDPKDPLNVGIFS